ncbi:hypothetical protein RHMOL_Rhmol07G0190300 [Rhododendron molle]|uniref:Uncharacterized protein n=1 Tax=Rhododendron molle TaxID=49168 RepID=A0ACC0N3C5_RHOML|nr:hypothetical protein RHMOL_Rhmol07G0190300 [Rhododendron molle]
MKVVKNYVDALKVCQLTDRNSLVDVYAVCNIIEEVLVEEVVHVEEEVHVHEVVATQCSQNLRKRGRGNKDSMSSKFDDDYFDESDGAIEEDDELFEINVDKEVEDFGFAFCSYPEFAHGGDDMAPIDDGSDDTEDLDTPSESEIQMMILQVFIARRKALAQLEGSAAKRFRNLCGYIEEVKCTNLGTTIKLKCKRVPGSEYEVKFKRLYICWGSLKKGFMEWCLSVIGLDGCHLKGSYGGILLTAVGMDANNCIYPFAYEVVEKEEKKTWPLFLELLKEDLDV